MKDFEEASILFLYIIFVFSSKFWSKESKQRLSVVIVLISVIFVVILQK